MTKQDKSWEKRLSGAADELAVDFVESLSYDRRRHKQFFFEMDAARIIDPHEWADKPDPLRWVTQEYTRAIEDWKRIEL